MMAALHREEKEIPFRREDVSDLTALYKLCMDHRVQLLLGEVGHISVRLSEKSLDLPNFALKIAELGLIDSMPEEKRGAYLHDLSTLECP